MVISTKFRLMRKFSDFWRLTGMDQVSLFCMDHSPQAVNKGSLVRPATSSLAELSYKLHQDLAKEFGRDSIGYRELTTVSVALDLVSNRRKRVPGAEWINDQAISKSSKLGDERTTAQVHPRLLTERLAKEVGKVVIASAERLESQDGKVSAVVAKTASGEEVKLECTDVVVAAGPWAGKLAEKLFRNDKDVRTQDLEIEGSRAHSVGCDTSSLIFEHRLRFRLSDRAQVIGTAFGSCSLYVDSDREEVLGTRAVLPARRKYVTDCL